MTRKPGEKPPYLDDKTWAIWQAEIARQHAATPPMPPEVQERLRASFRRRAALRQREAQLHAEAEAKIARLRRSRRRADATEP